MDKGSLRDIQLDDVRDFEITDSAMTAMGMTDNEKLNIYTIVAGVLHLGNVFFEDDPESKGVQVTWDDHQNHKKFALPVFCFRGVLFW